MSDNNIPRIVGVNDGMLKRIVAVEGPRPQFVVEINETGPRGLSLEFDVDEINYKIGVRLEGESEFQYVEFDEAERISNESARVAAENLRAEAEIDRDTAEGLRDTAEGLRDSAETARDTAEGLRDDAETLRQTEYVKMDGRITTIETTEEGRVIAEGARASAEIARNTAEGLRDSAETARNTAEGLRDSAEVLRLSAEEDRETAEELRDSAEVLRLSAEEDRETAEELRDSAETARDTAEGLRATAESGRVTAESNRNVFEAYDPLKTYVVNNKVALNGSSYLALVENTGKSPDSNPTEWLLIARKGDTGVVENLEASSIEDALGYLPESPTQVQTKIDSSLNAHKNNYVDPHMYLDEESGWTDVKYRLVMIEGKAFMEVVEVEVGGA